MSAGKLGVGVAGERGFERLEPRRLLAGAPSLGFSMGASLNDTVVDVARDALAGNVYVVGMFFGKMDFDPREGSQLVLTAAGTTTSPAQAAYVAKYTAAGVPVWAFPISLAGVGATVSGEVEGLRVDRVGRVYVSGFFSGTVDFNPAKGAAFVMETSAEDAFVAKYEANGAFAWATEIQNPRSSATGSHAPALTLVGQDVFVTGEFAAAGDGDGGFGHGFVATLDAATGAREQTHDLTAVGVLAEAARGTGIVQDSSVGAIVTGFTTGGETFVAKLTSTGHVEWARVIEGGVAGINAPSVAVDNRLNVYVTGAFGVPGAPSDGRTFDFDPGLGEARLASAGDLDTFVLRLNSLGDFVWVRRVGGEGQDVPGGIALDGQFNLHVVGTFTGTVDFRPGKGQFLLSAGVRENLYVLSLTPRGEFRSAFTVGGKRGSVGLLPSIWIRDNEMVIAGVLFGPIDFDPTGGTFVLTSDPETRGDVFVVRYGVE